MQERGTLRLMSRGKEKKQVAFGEKERGRKRKDGEGGKEPPNIMQSLSTKQEKKTSTIGLRLHQEEEKKKKALQERGSPCPEGGEEKCSPASGRGEGRGRKEKGRYSKKGGIYSSIPTGRKGREKKTCRLHSLQLRRERKKKKGKQGRALLPQKG